MQLANSILSEIRYIYALLSLTLRDVTTSGKEVLADFLIFTIRFGGILLIYKNLYTYLGGSVKGESYAVIAWSMFLYFVFMNINPRHIGRYIQSQVQTGEIQNFFGKPLSFLGFILGSYIGRRLHIFFLHSVLGLIFMFVVLGIPENILSLFFLSTFIITFIFCFLLSFFMFVCLGLLSFWIEDISPLSWIIDKFVMILGGAYLPVAFFPPILQKLAIWTPFGASQFLTSTVYMTWSSKYLLYWSIQFFWILFFGLLLMFMLKKVKHRLDVNGG